MAWNALTGQFRRRDEDTKRESDLFGSRPAGGSAGVGGGQAPSANPLGGFGGTGGSAGAPTSASHVNYGTLYSANEQKSKEMADRVYRGAEKKAEDAKGKLQGAQNTFTQQYNWGLGKGPGGAKVESHTPGAPPPRRVVANPPKPGTVGADGRSVHVQASSDPWTGPIHANVETDPAKRLQSDGTSGSVVVDYSLQDADAAQSLKEGARRKANSAGAQRYSSLYGPYIESETADMNAAPVDKGSLANYHQTASVMDAKSGAGQEYTGPGSLKEAVGDDAYAELAEELRKAQEGATGLSDAGGIAEALGYQGTEGDGMAAMDAGLTQTAGQSSFKDLARRYGNLGGLLGQAQADSLKSAEAGGIISDAAANEWQGLLDAYEAEEKAKQPAEKPYNPTQADQVAWDAFKGGDLGSLGQNALGTFGIGNTTHYKQLTDAGYSEAEIYKAYMKYRSLGKGNASPTAEQLLKILTAGD